MIDWRVDIKLYLYILFLKKMLFLQNNSTQTIA